ncbi:MAG: diacylglycerol kinase family lipid kinase [Muribaculaceae bacterium]|nr:diacylglycerol kinase family lipid kinase [Muribaculaceae bacterium]
MKPRALLIVNPISGTSKGKANIEALATEILGDSWDIVCRYTTARGDATRFAREAVADGFGAVIAAGGDGTVNETAAAMIDTGVPMGIVPCGSGNGLARHMDLPIDVRASLHVIAQNHVVAADYAEAAGRPYFCTFGVGYDAAVSDRFARMSRRGFISYLRSAFVTVRHFKPSDYVITLPDGTRMERRAFLVAVCNASQYGNNAYIAPHASITDGMLDVTIIDEINPLETAIVGLELMTGFIDRNTRIQTFRTTAIEIDKPAGPAHIDGEPVEMPTHVRIDCHPAALKVFASPDKRPFKPVITPTKSMAKDVKFKIRGIFRRRR